MSERSESRLPAWKRRRLTERFGPVRVPIYEALRQRTIDLHDFAILAYLSEDAPYKRERIVHPRVLAMEIAWWFGDEEIAVAILEDHLVRLDAQGWLTITAPQVAGGPWHIYLADACVQHEERKPAARNQNAKGPSSPVDVVSRSSQTKTQKQTAEAEAEADPDRARSHARAHTRAREAEADRAAEVQHLMELLARKQDRGQSLRSAAATLIGQGVRPDLVSEAAEALKAVER